MGNVVFITQARMGSTRLPGKVMKSVNGFPILYWFLKRSFKANYVNKWVVATSVNFQNDPLADFVKDHFPDCHVTRGSESDLLSRYKQAAEETDADVIVRVTSDCPFLDWALMDDCISRFLSDKCDALRTLRSNFPIGLDVEIFSRDCLEKADREAEKPEEREHVGPYVFNNPDVFNICWLANQGEVWPECRLTLDYQEDLDLIKILYSRVGPLSEANDFRKYLNDHPEIARINLKR